MLNIKNVSSVAIRFIRQHGGAPLSGLLPIVIVTLLSAACSPLHEKAQHAQFSKKIHHDRGKIIEYFKHPDKPTPGKVNVYDKFYVAKLKNDPLWVYKRIAFHGKAQLKTFVTQALSGTNVNVLFLGGADPKKILTVHSQGSLKRLLSYLESKTNYEFKVKKNSLKISDIVTKTFHISSIPGRLDFNVGKAANTTEIGTTGDAGAHGTQYTQDMGNISTWTDVEESIKNLLSKKGKIHVSQSNSSVTIIDHYRNVQNIALWIKQYNINLNTQVRFRVQILTVRLDKKHKRDFDLQAAFNNHNIQFNVKSGSESIFHPSGAGITSNGAQDSTFVLKSGKTSLSAFFQFLSTEGQISKQDETILTATNNHMAELRQAINVSYLKNVSITHNDKSDEITYTPGTYTTGLQLYIIPHIQGKKIQMKVVLAIGSLTNMDHKAISKLLTLDLPAVSIRRFNQNAVVLNKNTLVIGGFRTNFIWDGGTKNFGSGALGSYESQKTNQIIVVLITPYIAENTNND